MPKQIKSVSCSGCNGRHPRPAGKTCCPYMTGAPPLDPQMESPISTGVTNDQFSTLMNAVTALTNKVNQLEFSSKPTQGDSTQQQASTPFEPSTAQQTQNQTSTSGLALQPPFAGIQPHTQIGIIPPVTLEQLRANHTLQDSAQSTLDHLEELTQAQVQGTSQKLKSGRNRTVNDTVKVHVHWPNEFIYVDNKDERVQPLYKDLTLSQWVWGYSLILKNETNTFKKQCMIAHLAEMMRISSLNSWPIAKGIHSVILTEMEKGKLNWGDEQAFREIKETYSFTHKQSRDNSTFTNMHKQSRDNNQPHSKKLTLCNAYNKGACSQQNSHTTQNGLRLTHACSYCYNVKQTTYEHSEHACKRKEKSQSEKDLVSDGQSKN